MVRSCSAYGCTNRGNTNKNIQFHKFPLGDPQRLKKWLTAVRRERWKPTKSSLLCSDHFTDDCYKSKAKHFLKDRAVPSLFNFPPHLEKKTKKRREIQKHSLPIEAFPSDPEICVETEPSTSRLPTLFETNQEFTSHNTHEEMLQSCTPIEAFPPDPEVCVETEPSTSRLTTLFETNQEITSHTHEEMLQSCTPVTKLKNKKSPTKEELRKKIHNLQKKLARREKKIENLEGLLDTAKKLGGDMTEETQSMLQNTFGQLPFDLLIHQVKNKKRNPCGRRYSSAMKEFSLTLYFYSPRSYNFLRRKIHLPHPAMIRFWVSSVNCYPGFLEEAFSFLKESFQNSKFRDCGLIIDSMSIRKQVTWDKSRNKYSGYGECAGLMDEKVDTLASEALVFIIVSLTQRFKCPVAYFLIDKLNSNVLAELISVCIHKLADINLRVWSVTADGLSTNLSAFEKLGCKFSGCSTDQMKTYYLHPSNNLPIYVIFYACHMLKLARNTLADRQLCSNTGVISWEYLKKLNEIQSELGFKFSNKLSGIHINYKNKIMNVSIAAQTLSSSTADALDFLMKSKNPNFSSASATVEYIRVIDRLFDLCNSRNPFGKGFKAPLKSGNKDWWLEIFDESMSYLQNIQIDNIPILRTPRKMFALGFIITIKSLTMLASELLFREENPLKYFLTYKVSQDHIELFFNNIRACGGFNNNPNACQFRWALRKLLLSSNVSSRNSNCLANDCEIPSSILEFRSQKRALVDAPAENNGNYNVLCEYANFLDNENLSMYQEHIYIGGYIARVIMAKCSCINCIKMLVDENFFHNYTKIDVNNPKAFVQFVSRGKLKFCSSVVFKIICTAEKAFKLLVIKNKHKINVNKEIEIVTNEFLTSHGIQFSHEIQNEIGCEELHESQMVRKIIEIYLKIRLNSYSKTLTLQNVHNNKATVRQKLTKLILFQNV